MNKVPNISVNLNKLINDLLEFDNFNNIWPDKMKSEERFKQLIDDGELAIKILTEKGILDVNGQFEDDENLEGEYAVAAKWIKENI